MGKRWNKPLAGAIAAFLLALPATSGTISDTIFSVYAKNTLGEGTVSFNKSELVFNNQTGGWDWTKGSVPIKNGQGDEIAVLGRATMFLVSDPGPGQAYRINFGFLLNSGLDVNNPTAPTEFVVRTAKISFPTLPKEILQAPNGGGRATVAVGLTDLQGDGAKFEAIGGDGRGSYWAKYNGEYPGGTRFANLLNLVEVAKGGGSGNGDESYPPVGNASINDNVSDMSVAMHFTLSAADQASSTSSYRIVPEPVTCGLWALALALLRRPR